MKSHLNICLATMVVVGLACRKPEVQSMVPKRVDYVSIQYPKPTVFITMGKIPKEWLHLQTTVDQAEKSNLVSNPSLGSKPVPFGFIHNEWITFKQLMTPGDELWEYNEHGGSGLCIVRSKTVIASLSLTIN